MNYHTHSIFGLFFTLITVKILSDFNIVDMSYLLKGSLINGTLIKFYLAAMIGSLLPDLDHAQSKAGKFFWFISKPMKLIGIKHRGLTHSLIGVVLFGLLSKQLVIHNWIELVLWHGLMIGYVSHLIADMMNVQGLPLLFPIKKRFKFYSNITTNSWQEQFLVSLIIISIVIIILHERSYLRFNDLINLISLN